MGNQTLPPDLETFWANDDDVFSDDEWWEEVSVDIMWDEWGSETPQPAAWGTGIPIAWTEWAPAPAANPKISEKDDDLIKELKEAWFTDEQINTLEDDELLKQYEEKLKANTSLTDKNIDEQWAKIKELDVKTDDPAANKDEVQKLVTDLQTLNQRISAEHNITIRENERLLDKIKSFESREDDRASEDIYNRVNLKGIKDQPQVVMISKLMSRIKAWDENAKDWLFDAIWDLLYEGTGQNFSELMDIAKEKRAEWSTLLNWKKEWADLSLNKISTPPPTEEDMDSVI